MTSRRSERTEQLAAIWQRIKAGEAHIAACRAEGRPYDRSSTHLETLKAEYLALMNAPSIEDDDEEEAANEPVREWGVRRCPICGARTSGLWEPGSTVYCGPCAIERQRRLAGQPLPFRARKTLNEAV